MQVAQDMGLKVEKRPLPVSEVPQYMWFSIYLGGIYDVIYNNNRIFFVSS